MFKLRKMMGVTLKDHCLNCVLSMTQIELDFQ